MSVTLITGDCREVMPAKGPFDLIVADPPYADTNLDWDRCVEGWERVALAHLKPTGSMWVFGSMRYFLTHGIPAGWRYAQDIVWEKHNGSGLARDRFRRVHEHAVQLYPTTSLWSDVYNKVQVTHDADARRIRRNNKPQHWGGTSTVGYESDAGGPRLMRSVVFMRSAHGRAIHPTEKPASLLELLVRTSCPAGGLVGDFFAGSGAAGEACIKSGRSYVGAELDPDMADKARARLDSVTLPLSLEVVA